MASPGTMCCVWWDERVSAITGMKLPLPWSGHRASNWKDLKLCCRLRIPLRYIRTESTILRKKVERKWVNKTLEVFSIDAYPTSSTFGRKLVSTKFDVTLSREDGRDLVPKHVEAIMAFIESELQDLVVRNNGDNVPHRRRIRACYCVFTRHILLSGGGYGHRRRGVAKLCLRWKYAGAAVCTTLARIEKLDDESLYRGYPDHTGRSSQPDHRLENYSYDEGRCQGVESFVASKQGSATKKNASPTFSGKPVSSALANRAISEALGLQIRSDIGELTSSPFIYPTARYAGDRLSTNRLLARYEITTLRKVVRSLWKPTLYDRATESNFSGNAGGVGGDSGVEPTPTGSVSNGSEQLT
ncbi:unnamed protein product [Cercospora beticola]|nr:unnamed protein product [Cercospora beticola]